ncbi:MAG: hypothetical protein JJ975_16155 [Bacteroidia bacterium]|nr:hypothetical protein [Bacteroidia bacterium]
MKRLKEIFQRVDAQLLKKKPIQWILGLHIFPVLVAVIGLVLFLIGTVYSLVPLPNWRDFREFFETLNMAMILPTILLTILFIIRQVKYNSKRVHLKLPHANSFAMYLYFIGIFILITAMPFTGNLGAFLKTGMVLNKTEFLQDQEALNRGYAHFRMTKRRVTDSDEHLDEEQLQDDATGIYYLHDQIYKLSPEGDKLIFKRKTLTSGYYAMDQYVNYNSMDTVPLSQVYSEIEAFVEVAAKYQGKTTRTNPIDIVQHNLKAKKIHYGYGDMTPAFNHFENYEQLDNNIYFNEQFEDNDGPYFIMSWSFWKFYWLLALGLATLLILLCSVNIRDFGWAMLSIALHPTVYGIVFALFMFVGDFDDESLALGLLILFNLFAMFVAFGSNFKPTVKRAYAITLHVYAPILTAIYLTLFNEMSHGGFDDGFAEFVLICVVIVALVSTYAFGKYYKKQYVDPQG